MILYTLISKGNPRRIHPTSGHSNPYSGHSIEEEGWEIMNPFSMQ